MQIQPFNFNGSEVRTLVRDGDPWFVAADVCAILDIRNTRDAVSSLDADEAFLTPVATSDGSGRELPTNIISESGLYSLVLRSRKPEAKAFKRWVTREVLPTIRKTGSYQVAKSPALPGSYIEALEALVASEKSKAQLQAKNAEMAPKAAYFDAVAASEDMIPIATAAKTLRLPYGSITLFRKLREDGILMKRNEPYQEYVNAGYFVVRQGTRIGSTGKSHITHTTKVTGKGMEFLRRRYCSNDGELGLL